MNQKKENKATNKISDNDVAKLQLELEKLKKEAQEYKNKYLRALADYQNYEKRVSDEKLQIREQAAAQIILKLLPFIDNLDKAEVFIKDSGLKMVKDSFDKILIEMGLEEIQILGKEFDPHLAEAVDIVPGEKDNAVAEVLRRGYKLNDRILRVAQVKVTKKIQNSESKVQN